MVDYSVRNDKVTVSALEGTGRRNDWRLKRFCLEAFPGKQSVTAPT